MSERERKLRDMAMEIVESPGFEGDGRRTKRQERSC